MVTTRTNRLRQLGPADLPELLALADADPVTNVFVAYRARQSRLEPARMAGSIWGWFADDELVSALHAGPNIVPVALTEAAAAAFATKVLARQDRPATIVGDRDQVTELWDHLQQDWPAPREARWEQPLMSLNQPPAVEPDPQVRITRPEEVGVLFPASVAMYTEEIGTSPIIDGQERRYRARVEQLVRRGWSFSRIARGRVEFKAEVTWVSPDVAQVQGVWVPPELRGQGIATAGMAAVVKLVQERLAPTVALYVNHHNTAARTVYERVGFEQVGVFSTLMY